VHTAIVKRDLSTAGQLNRNPNWTGYRCIACEQFWPHSALDLTIALGCPSCRQRGAPVNLRCEYIQEPGNNLLPMPYSLTKSLGEGRTALVAMPANHNDSTGFFKLELANPTGSHKDRMAALALADAFAQGKQRVLAASSGNAGVAIAAYAGMYGLACEIAVTRDCPELYLNLIRSYGANLVICATSMERWAYLERASAEQDLAVLTNYVVPAVGSPPVAIEAYKQIAIELHQEIRPQAQLGSIYVPVARGDLLWGLYMGFEHLLLTKQIKVMPRLVAVEPFARLSLALAGISPQASFNGQSKQSSIAGSTITMQSVLALQRSAGTALVVGDDEAISAREALAKRGFLFELCAAAAWAAYQREQQREQKFEVQSQASATGKNICNIVIATSHGSRDAHLFN
jgi:threonine synthase